MNAAKHNPERAFERAIASDLLSDNPRDTNYAGLYMWMGLERWDGPMIDDKLFYCDTFKHIDTRRYIRGAWFPEQEALDHDRDGLPAS